MRCRYYDGRLMTAPSRRFGFFANLLALGNPRASFGGRQGFFFIRTGADPTYGTLGGGINAISPVHLKLRTLAGVVGRSLPCHKLTYGRLIDRGPCCLTKTLVGRRRHPILPQQPCWQSPNLSAVEGRPAGPSRCRDRGGQLRRPAEAALPGFRTGSISATT